MGAASSYETEAKNYKLTPCHIPEDCNDHQKSWQNLKLQTPHGSHFTFVTTLNYNLYILLFLSYIYEYTDALSSPS
jgi:hypothetical protein